MTKQEFKELSQQGVIFLDGATGTNLQKRGMPSGVCPEKWILEHEDVFVELQKEFVKAGSQILYAPTFGANRIKLAKYNLESELEEINRKLVRLSKKVADDKAYVAGDLTMTGSQLKPCGELNFEELIEVYREQILCLEKSGVDLFVIETMITLQEARAALIAANESSDLPMMVTLTFTEEGNTLYGTSPEAAVITLQELGAAAVGANCSVGPNEMIEIIQRMKKYAKIPLIAKPNAGIPKMIIDILEDEKTGYNMPSQEFAKYMRKLVEAGASILGGCCGTTPIYIEQMIRSTKGCFERVSPIERQEYISSSRKICVAEQELLEEIKIESNSLAYIEAMKGDYELVLDSLEERKTIQERILKVLFPSRTKWEKIRYQNLLQEIMMYYDVPLCIEIEDEELLDKLLRIYSGRAFVSLKSLREEKKVKFQEICRRYGAFSE